VPAVSHRLWQAVKLCLPLSCKVTVRSEVEIKKLKKQKKQKEKKRKKNKEKQKMQK
jgi:hypothetical protein